LPGRRATRFALEVLFLVALAATLSFTTLKPARLAGFMLLGWLFVVIFEWASLRSRPHWRSGSPPRYYVPPVKLPPSVPLDRPAHFPVPDARDAPTWLAPAAEREDDWPWLREPEREEAIDESVLPEPVTSVGAVPVVEPEPEPQPEPAVESEPAGEPVHAAATAVAAAALAGPEPPGGHGRAEPSRAVPVEIVSSQGALRMSRHRIDPLQPSSGRRRRRRNENDGMIEVPARPTVRVRPGASRREE
jgi:hypothetical protein